MSNSQQDEQQALEQYLEEKAKQDQESRQASEPLSEYKACVLRESARVKDLIAEAQKGKERSEDE